MFAILISTKNRKTELLFTLKKIDALLQREDVECVVFDDGSDDGTFDAVKQNFPQVKLQRNEISRGYMYCRNKLLNEATAAFAISLDDDAHFLSADPLEQIQSHFESHPQCGLTAFRLWWSRNDSADFNTHEKTTPVKGFVGCGHAWRIEAWRGIRNYPEWFQFYGEEDFASMELFKQGYTVDYLPKVLVQHRVDLKARSKTQKDFGFRYRRSFRAGWYLYFLFYPASKIPRKLLYTLFIQVKKIFKGNFNVIAPLFLSVFDVLKNLPRLRKSRRALTIAEYNRYVQLNETKIFWNPEK